MSLYQPNLEKDVMVAIEFWENKLLFKIDQSHEKNLKSVKEIRENISKVYDIRKKELLDHQHKLVQHKKVERPLDDIIIIFIQ
jgi:hypothetical protein